MNFAKIEVDKLPENCFHGNCIFPRYSMSQITEYWECLITEKMIKDDEKCPDWCPLVVEDDVIFEEFCKWKRSENPNWYWQTECGDWFYDRSHTYCSCGKPIKYMEEE